MNAKRVLVVEDDLDFLRALVIRLKASGYEVLSATDGVQAIGVARRDKPDLILLDIGLPGGDGYVVMDRLRLLNGVRTPILVLSAKDPATHREKALAAGASVFFHKPVENHVLLATMRRLLGEPTKPVRS
jgi:two-component system KDP operon response regulator KdpE